jgi:2-keto-4-pentenoate hydratase/2-oxohepta-3-ene-1,7-dioic acid hydratase in catechol pathway
MRLCRYQHNGTVEVAIYENDRIISVNRVASELNINVPTANSTNMLDYLAPHGRSAKAVQQLADRFAKLSAAEQRRLSRPMKETRLRVPIADPKKVILLAGNYAAHIVEGGGTAPERAATFPYFFWKPPTTTLCDPGAPIRIPRVSPDHVDWEIELGVIMGRTARHVTEKDALEYVAGYTVCNDVSDRRFRINPQRKPRDKDAFFDWQHGKWHDTFLPMGPCVRAAASVPDPQKMRLVLKVNGKIMQDANTAQMIFPVAAIVSILSSFVTLEPGDIIVTGTPSGVGHARKPPIYLRPKDEVEAEIESIGVLRNPVEAEK